MSHDKYLVIDCNILSQCFCFNTGFDTRVLCSHLTLAAIICNTMAVFDNSLIAASGKSQINGNTGIIITLGIITRTESQTNTQCQWNLITDIDCFYILEKREFVILQSLELLLLQSNKIFVRLGFLYDSVCFCNILVDLAIHQRN